MGAHCSNPGVPRPMPMGSAPMLASVLTLCTSSWYVQKSRHIAGREHKLKGGQGTYWKS